MRAVALGFGVGIGLIGLGVLALFSAAAWFSYRLNREPFLLRNETGARIHGSVRVAQSFHVFDLEAGAEDRWNEFCDEDINCDQRIQIWRGDGSAECVLCTEEPWTTRTVTYRVGESTLVQSVVDGEGHEHYTATCSVVTCPAVDGPATR